MNAKEAIDFLQQKLSSPEEDTIRLQCIFKAIPDGVAIADQKRNLVMVNSAFSQIFGYHEEELIGRSTEMIYANKEDFDRLGNIRFRMDCHENLDSYEILYKRKDGSQFYGESIGAPICDENGKIYGFIGVIRDISVRKKREQALTDLEQMYRTVANFTYDWEIWENSDSSFHYVSPSCERITGYKPDQFIKTPELFYSIIVSEDKKIWDSHCHDKNDKLAPTEVQFRIKKKDGSLAWIEHACQPVTGAAGEKLGFRSSNRDITQRKKVELALSDALEKINKYKEQLEEETACLHNEINLVRNYKRIIGSSNALQYVLFKIEQVAATDSTVIIFGETGTGKELFARAVYENSLRTTRPMLTLNCAALPTDLIESELFGHERGAFTGAHASKKGRFENADKGTLFLDEIGELPLDAQAKLLRVLQSGEIERLGSSQTTRVDVRVIAATNRNLEEDVRKGKFREDLWYRLNVFPITVPPLRERLEDIPQLFDFFVDKFSRKQGKNISSFGTNVLQTLQQYNWPGNIRELENVIERAVITTTGSTLTLANALTPSLVHTQKQLSTLADMERKYIIEVLEKTKWKVSGKNSAAEILGLRRSTLRAKIDKLNIRKP